MQDVQRDITVKMSHNVLIPPTHISVSVEMGWDSIGCYRYWILGVGQYWDINYQ